MRVFSCGSDGWPFQGLRVTSLSVQALCLAVLLGVLPGPVTGQFPGEVSGQVLDAVSSRPVAGVTVLLPQEGRRIVSDGDGQFHLRGLSPGEIELHLHRFGYEPRRVRVEVRNGQVQPVEIRLSPRPLPTRGVEVAVQRAGGHVLTRETIAESGAGTLGEVIAGIPGAMVVGRGPGGSEEVRIRGSAADQVLVLVDGVMLNDPVTGVADLSSIRAAMVERVQLIPGALGARFGPGAMGGVVLVQTRQAAGPPVELDLGSGSLDARELGVRLSRNAAGTRGWGSGRFRTQKGEFEFQEPPNPGGGTARRRNADLLQATVSGGLESEGTLPGRSSVQIRAEEMRRGLPGKSFAPSDSARQTQRSVTASAGWVRSSAGSRVEARAHHRFQEVRFSDPSPPLGRPFDDRTRFLDTGGTLRGERHAEWLADGLVGSDLELTRWLLAGDAMEGEDARSSIHLGLGLQAETGGLDLLGSPALSGAIRIHRDGHTDRWLGAHDLTIRVGDGAVQAHLAHRSSFSPPSAGDLFFREGVGIRPNPELRPERVPGEVELGLSSRFRVGPLAVHLSGDVFRGDLEDMIVWVPDFRFVWSPRNVDVKRRGGQVALEIRDPSTGLRASAHYGSNRVTYLRGGGTPGVQVIYRPRDSGGGSLAWVGDRLRASLDARYTGSRFPVPAAANRLDPFWTAGLTSAGRFDVGGWSVEPRLRVDRLLDERSPFIHAFPEPGRTFQVEVHLRPERP